MVVQHFSRGGNRGATLHPGDRARVDEALGHAAATGGAYAAEYRMVSATGETFWLQDWGSFARRRSGPATSGVGARADITPQKLAQVALRDSEERAALALQASRVYAWERDIGSREVRRTGDVADVLGAEVGTIDAFIARVHGNDRATVSTAIMAAIENDVPYDVEFRYDHSDNTEIWVSDIGRKIVVDGRERFVGITADITARKRLEAAVHASEARFRDVAEASADWIWETDEDFHLTYVSDRFSEMTGHPAGDVLGLAYTGFLRTPSDGHGWREHDVAIQARVQFRNVTAEFIDPAGRTRICRLSGQPAHDGERRFIGYRGTASDATDEIEARGRAEHLALHDGLTGLPNRRRLYQQLRQALDSREGNDVAVLFIDLDFFKEVNDSFGHRAGDELLQQFSEMLIGAKRKGDTAARVGGDEFVLVMTGVRGLDEVEHVAQNLLARMALPFVVDGHEVYIGLSIGAAIASTDGNGEETLLRAADTALYRAKAIGRGALCFFEPELDAAQQSRKALEQDLRGAIGRNELEVHFQPLIAVDSQQIVGVEALLRWNHPRDGAIGPDTFIPIAEQSGSILPIGEWVLRRACLTALPWSELRLSVNVSPVQFRQPGFFETLCNTLAQTGFPPERLELEITEGVLLNDTEGALKTFNRIKALGVKMAMDDFGTGYSSLSYLQRFAFDKIKIDQSFVHGINSDDDAASIIGMALTLAKRLGIETNAEGVETAAQFAALEVAGCDQVQGYLFSRAVPATELTRMLATERRSRHGVEAIARY